MKKPEKHFVNHSEVLQIIGRFRFDLMEKLGKNENDKTAKNQLSILEAISDELTCALFEKGSFGKQSTTSVNHEGKSE